MVIIVAINGFGRIGRVIFRKCFENPEVEISAINDPAIDIEYICYLIKFDSTHGKFKGNITYKDNEIIINDKKIKVFRERLPSKVPWETVGAQYIVEATGMFTSLEKASGHLESQFVRRVIVTAPAGDIPMIIMGVNDNDLKQEQKVLSCASSTLYCLAPIIKVLNDCYEVVEGFVTSIHAMTPSLKPLDGLCLRGKHWRDHRSIHQNIIPASTGACKALGKVIPEVKDKLTGLAFRVPIVNVSVLDITVRLNTETSLSDIVKSVEKASGTYLEKIIKISNENAVSSDFIGDSHSCTLDVDSSLELKPNFFKLVCWYENEYSYATRVLDSIFFCERQIRQSMLITKAMPGLKYEDIDRKVSKECTISNGDDCEQRFTQKLPQKYLKYAATPASSDSIKKQNEISKIWNDDCDTSRNCKGQKCSSSFQRCVPVNPKTAKETDRFKAKEHLDDVKREFSKMLLITEDLLQRSNSDKINLKRPSNRFRDSKEANAFRKVTIDSQEDIETILKRMNEKAQTHRTILKECGDFKNKIISESCINIHKNEDINNNEEDKCETSKMNKNIETKRLSKDDENKNFNGSLINESNKIYSHTDPTGDMIQTNKKRNLLEDGISRRHKFNLKLTATNTYLNDELRNKKDHEQVFIESGFQTDSPDEKFACDIRSNQCTTNKNKEKYIAVTDYLQLKNYNMHIIDEELKKRNIKLLDSGTNINTLLNCDKELSVAIDREENLDIQIIAGQIGFDSKTNEFPQGGHSKNTLNLMNKIGKEELDIYDKLDSTSETNSNESFDIIEKKSQIINITDLTRSLEDVARLDKICRIIEISDELSNELFSPLNNSDTDSTVEKRSWSFKNLCERIQLDDFCKKVFGETEM